MSMKKFWVVSLAVLLISVIVFCSCASEAPKSIPATTPAPKVATSSPPALKTATVTPRYGGVLKVVASAAMTVIGYPPELGVAGALTYANICLESLLVADTTGRYLPRLASAYEISPDKKSIKLTLRKGVKFHDGTDWNATAAKWNLDRALKANPEGAATAWDSIDIIDDYAIRVNLKRFENTVLSGFAGVAGYVCSPAAVEKNGIDWARVNPVGTGPFKFVSFQRDVSITYERFDTYWGGKPYLEGIKFIRIQDPVTTSLAFQKGEVDSISVADPKSASELRDKGYNILSGTTAMICLLPDSVNSASPLANKTVREAVEYAINRESIVKGLGLGFWNSVNQHCPRGFMGYVTDIPGRNYDPAKAKQLLTQAGYPEGFKTQIIANAERFNKDSLVAIQQYLSEVGIKAELNILSQPAWTENETKGWQNGLLAQSFGLGTYYLSHFPRFLASNVAHAASTTRPAGFDQLMNEALLAADYGTANQLTQKLVRLLYDNATTLPLWVTTGVRAEQKYVHDSGWYSTGGILDWTPEKAWLSQ